MWRRRRHYAVDPMSGAAADFEPEEKGRILGGEACMWTEWLLLKTSIHGLATQRCDC